MTTILYSYEYGKNIFHFTPITKYTCCTRSWWWHNAHQRWFDNESARGKKKYCIFVCNSQLCAWMKTYLTKPFNDIACSEDENSWWSKPVIIWEFISPHLFVSSATIVTGETEGKIIFNPDEYEARNFFYPALASLRMNVVMLMSIAIQNAFSSCMNVQKRDFFPVYSLVIFYEFIPQWVVLFFFHPFFPLFCVLLLLLPLFFIHKFSPSWWLLLLTNVD